MRIALFSDVHANLHALDAVLADIRSRSVDAVYHLGDLVGYAAFPNETVETVQREGIRGVSGNYDSTVATRYDHCGCKYEDPHQAELSHLSFEWTLEHTNPRSRAILGALPFRLDVKPGGGHAAGPTLILVHGTPTLNTLYWHADRSDDFCRTMGRKAGARAGDIVACGHTHIAWVREVEGVHYLNTGSVGRPKDGDWRAGYVMLEVGDTSPEVEFVRVEYNLEAACEGILRSALPDFFADYLRAGGPPEVRR